MPLTMILDIDGTLVDTNYQHALCWFRALRQRDQIVPVAHIHRHIGIGGDQIVKALVSVQFEREHGDDVRAAEGALYKESIREVVPLPGAREFVLDLKSAEHTVVLASSAKQEEVEHYLDLLDLREVADAWTTSADVATTKPDPDLIKAALGKAAEAGGPGAPANSLMVGDTVWDCIAAAKAGVRSVGVLTGGFGGSELREAGAIEVFDSVGQMRGELSKLTAGEG